MAILTNRMNLPQQILTAIRRDPYSRGDADISVTQLIKPPRIVQLQKRHDEQIQEDASDRIWALLGQLGHAILERGDPTGAVHEKRISVMVDGWKVSGASDVYVTQQAIYEADVITYREIPPTIRDYKFIKVMAAGFDHPDWEEQLNLLAYLWREQGFPVDNLEIVAIYRDWSKVLYERNPHGYPPAAKVYKQKLWDHELQERFIGQRVAMHKMAERVEDKFLPFCTPEDQWRRPPKWAVMHPKKVKAVKLCDTHDEAQTYILGIGKDRAAHFIEHRPSVATRCEMFCDVNCFCDQYAAERIADNNKKAA
ncbi:MAG: hypothetical protein AB9866_21460 [Syntrophobacteraceae bacterium]